MRWIADKFGNITGRSIAGNAGEFHKPVMPEEKCIWNSVENKFEYMWTNYSPIDCEESSYKDKFLDFVHNIETLLMATSYGRTWEFSSDDRIAVLIPCYGKAAYIMETVKSVLCQTKKVDEIIILLMDEKSQSMKESLENLDTSIKCEICERLNPVKSRLKLLKMTDAEWVVFLDADDILSLDYIEITSSMGGAVNASFYHLLDDKTGKIDFAVDYSSQRADNHPSNIIINNLTALVRKEVFLDMGLDEKFCFGGEDLDFLLRLLEEKKYLVRFTKDTYYAWRINERKDLQVTRRADNFEYFKSAFLRHADFFAEELIAIANTKDYRFGKIVLLVNILKTYKNDRTKFEFMIFNYQEMNKCPDLERKEIFPEIYNYLISNLAISREREPLSGYNPEKFTLLGELPAGINEEDLDGLCFDGLIFLNIDAADIFSIVVNTEILNMAKDSGAKSRYDIILYLLQNHSIFIWDNKENFRNIVLRYKDFDFSNSDFLPEKIRAFFSSLKKVEAEETFIFNTEINLVQKATFQLDLYCNKKCLYCNQHCDTKFNEGILLSNFMAAIDKAEKLCTKLGRKLVPQIMGGEPTLLSEYVIDKIMKRLAKYRKVEIFTNLANPKSSILSYPNVELIMHITEWKGKHFYDYKPVPNGWYVVVVCRDEIEEFEKFLKGDGEKAYFNALSCNGDKRFACDIDDIKRLYKVCKDNGVFMSTQHFAERMEQGLSLKNMQRQCVSDCGLWTFSCGENEIKVSPCCGLPCNIPLDVFDPYAKRGDCGDCMDFGNML